MEKWKKIGEIGIDSGRCWVGDPYYIIKKKPEISSHRYENDVEMSTTSYVQHTYALGHKGVGVSVDTGYGDGIYDVEAVLTKDGRTKQIRIIFIDDND